MIDSDGDPLDAHASPAEIGALAHLYRAEVFRSTAWRQRLDMTTNWAVVSTGIALSVSFASESASPLPIVLVGLLSIMFLILEARRYRYFSVWKFRARMLEIANFVPMLRGEGARIALDRGTALSDDYIRPRHRITAIRALGRRIRSNYGWIFIIQGIAYLAKIAIHPSDVTSWGQFLERTHIGPLPGWMALIAGAMFHVGWISIAAYTWRQEKADKGIMADYLHPETP